MPFWSLISVELHPETLYLSHTVSFSFRFRRLHRNFAILINKDNNNITNSGELRLIFTHLVLDVGQVYYPLYIG